MSLESRLKTLAEHYSMPLNEVSRIYNMREFIISITYRNKYNGRESHIRYLAYKGTENVLKNIFEEVHRRINKRI